MSEWWDEDPEMLGATLGLLAAWDRETTAPGPDSLALSPSPPPSPSSPDSSGSNAATTQSGSSTSASDPDKRRRRSINVSRERRKQELQFLRTKVEHMQRQLGELRERREAQLRPHFRGSQLASVAPVWESLATRQFRARRQSELRNAKLKTLLGAQLRVAEDLIRVIRHAEQRSRQAVPGMPATEPRIPIDVSQRMSEEDQLARLDVLCANCAAEFVRCDKFAPRGSDHNSAPELQFLDMRVAEDSHEATIIELFSSSVLPYPVARVEETMWGLFMEDGDIDEDGESFTQTATATENLIIGVFSATTTVDDGLRGTIHGKCVTRRIHPTATQAGFVSHTQSEPQGFSNQLDGVEMFEDSWVRLVDASELGHTNLGGPLTVIQHVRRERIVFRGVSDDNSTDATRSRIEKVTRIVMNQIREEINWAQQTVENLLMVNSKSIKNEPR